MRPTERLCLLLVKGHWSEEDREAILALTRRGANWQAVLRVAIEQEVYPLLHKSLRQLDFPDGADIIREELASLIRTNALRNELMLRELTTLFAALHAAAIPVIPLKGPVLAKAVYGDYGLRECADLDILVPRDRVRQTFDILLSKGYQADYPEWVVNNSILRRGIELALQRSGKSMQYSVEIHWGLFSEGSPREANMAVLWADSRRGDLRGVPARFLSAEWQVLYLLAHAARHNWEGVKWLVDIHAICCQQHIQWCQVFEKSRLMGWERLVQWTLSVCHSILRTPLPSGLEFLLPSPPERLLQDLFRSGSPRWRKLLVALRVEHGIAGKGIFLARRLFLPTAAEYALFRAPYFLSFLYYPARPLRILLTSGKAIVGRVIVPRHAPQR
jgi:putative nucleotidyltransferase-like protein